MILESAHGDRNHCSLHETAIEARKIIAKAIEAKAKILVRVFAVGRTQLLLYLLAAAFRNQTMPRFFRLTSIAISDRSDQGVRKAQREIRQ